MNNGSGYSEVLEQQNVEIGLGGAIKSSAAAAATRSLQNYGRNFEREIRAAGAERRVSEQRSRRQEARGCAELAVNVPKRASK